MKELKNEPFIIKIDDGFCEWAFQIKFEDGDNLSIQSIIDTLLKELKGEEIQRKLISM